MINIPDGLDYESYVDLLGNLEAQDLRSSAHWRQELLEYNNSDELIHGDTLPFPKAHSLFRYRPSEMTLVTGFNGSKKSMVLGQIMLHLAKTKKVCICSLEMQPTVTLHRMLMQAAGASDGRPADRFVEQFMDWADNRIYIFDALDTLPPERIIGFIHYATKELGCEHIVLDSLSKVALKYDDYNQQNEFINKMQYIVKRNKAHLHIVTHVKKPQNDDESIAPSRYSIRGAGSLSDMADNVMIIQPNRKREALKEIAKTRELDEKQQDYLQKTKDHAIIIAKQRHAAWEGSLNFYFHSNSLQLTEREGMPHKFSFDTVVDTDN
jgi:twinkle protein